MRKNEYLICLPSRNEKGFRSKNNKNISNQSKGFCSQVKPLFIHLSLEVNGSHLKRVNILCVKANLVLAKDSKGSSSPLTERPE